MFKEIAHFNISTDGNEVESSVLGNENQIVAAIVSQMIDDKTVREIVLKSCNVFTDYQKQIN